MGGMYGTIYGIPHNQNSAIITQITQQFGELQHHDDEPEAMVGVDIGLEICGMNVRLHKITTISMEDPWKETDGQHTG